MATEPSTYLHEAARLVEGERSRDYGDAHTNFANIAVGWTVLLGSKVTPEQVALCLSWLKLARLSSPTISPEAATDSVVDGCGYIALAGSLRSGSGQSNDV